MSNRVYITPTEFKNARTGQVSYGVRAYDDESSDFIDCWDDIPGSNREVLQRVFEDAGRIIGDMLDFATYSEKGVYVGGEWFSADDIRSCSGEAEEECDHEDQ